MATLSASERGEISEALCQRNPAVNYTKPQIGAAVQAVEDWFEGGRAGLNAAINAATAPLVLTAAQKKHLVVHFLLQKARREDT
jgi:hypothetical protein